MRKTAAIIIAVIFVLSLASCSSKVKYDTPQEGIIGVWKYSPNEEIRDIITDAVTDPGVYVDLYYEFYEDGTGKTYLSTDDNEMTFTYTYDGETLTITSKSGSFDTPAKLDGDILSVYDTGNDEYLDLKRQ
ncbi:MAG: hypothetical protein IJF69_01080 [Clostridia bacterium]|nr:hypothetical protein [Clostridia bacterium]